MITISLVRHKTYAHVYVTRWTGHQRYPVQIIDLTLPMDESVPGRVALRAAARAVLDSIDDLD